MDRSEGNKMPLRRGRRRRKDEEGNIAKGPKRSGEPEEKRGGAAPPSIKITSRRNTDRKCALRRHTCDECGMRNVTCYPSLTSITPPPESGHGRSSKKEEEVAAVDTGAYCSKCWDAYDAQSREKEETKRTQEKRRKAQDVSNTAPAGNDEAIGDDGEGEEERGEEEEEPTPAAVEKMKGGQMKKAPPTHFISLPVPQEHRARAAVAALQRHITDFYRERQEIEKRERRCVVDAKDDSNKAADEGSERDGSSKTRERATSGERDDEVASFLNCCDALVRSWQKEEASVVLEDKAKRSKDVKRLVADWMTQKEEIKDAECRPESSDVCSAKQGVLSKLDDAVTAATQALLQTLLVCCKDEFAEGDRGSQLILAIYTVLSSLRAAQRSALRLRTDDDEGNGNEEEEEDVAGVVASYMYDVTRMHITLDVLRLDTAEKVTKCIDAMHSFFSSASSSSLDQSKEEAKSKEEGKEATADECECDDAQLWFSQKGHSIDLSLRGIGEFGGGKVIFVKCQDSAAATTATVSGDKEEPARPLLGLSLLRSLRTRLLRHLIAHGLCEERSDRELEDFTPHITVAKESQAQRRSKGHRGDHGGGNARWKRKGKEHPPSQHRVRVERCSYAEYANADFGAMPTTTTTTTTTSTTAAADVVSCSTCTFDELRLCRMDAAHTTIFSATL